MDPSPEELAKNYGRMSDRELVDFAQDYASLTETAQALLRAEFDRRHLEPPLIEDPELPPTGRSLVTVRRYRDLSEAIVARSLLESAGIGVYLRDENLVRLEWQISNFIGGIRLQVAETDKDAALDILTQPIPDDVEFADQTEFVQPICPQCGSKDITFEGSSRGAALASLYLLSLPLPLGKETWFCNHCQARWEDQRLPDEITSRP